MEPRNDDDTRNSLYIDDFDDRVYTIENDRDLLFSETLATTEGEVNDGMWSQQSAMSEVSLQETVSVIKHSNFMNFGVGSMPKYISSNSQRERLGSYFKKHKCSALYSTAQAQEIFMSHIRGNSKRNTVQIYYDCETEFYRIFLSFVCSHPLYDKGYEAALKNGPRVNKMSSMRKEPKKTRILPRIYIGARSKHSLKGRQVTVVTFSSGRAMYAQDGYKDLGISDMTKITVLDDTFENIIVDILVDSTWPKTVRRLSEVPGFLLDAISNSGTPFESFFPFLSKNVMGTKLPPVIGMVVDTVQTCLFSNGSNWQRRKDVEMEISNPVNSTFTALSESEKVQERRLIRPFDKKTRKFLSTTAPSLKEETLKKFQSKDFEDDMNDESSTDSSSIDGSQDDPDQLQLQTDDSENIWTEKSKTKQNFESTHSSLKHPTLYYSHNGVKLDSGIHTSAIVATLFTVATDIVSRNTKSKSELEKDDGRKTISARSFLDPDEIYRCFSVLRHCFWNERDFYTPLQLSQIVSQMNYPRALECLSLFLARHEKMDSWDQKDFQYIQQLVEHFRLVDEMLDLVYPNMSSKLSKKGYFAKCLLVSPEVVLGKRRAAMINEFARKASGLSRTLNMVMLVPQQLDNLGISPLAFCESMNLLKKSFREEESVVLGIYLPYDLPPEVSYNPDVVVSPFSICSERGVFNSKTRMPTTSTFYILMEDTFYNRIVQLYNPFLSFSASRMSLLSYTSLRWPQIVYNTLHQGIRGLYWSMRTVLKLFSDGNDLIDNESSLLPAPEDNVLIANSFALLPRILDHLYSDATTLTNAIDKPFLNADRDMNCKINPTKMSFAKHLRRVPTVNEMNEFKDTRDIDGESPHKKAKISSDGTADETMQEVVPLQEKNLFMRVDENNNGSMIFDSGSSEPISFRPNSCSLLASIRAMCYIKADHFLPLEVCQKMQKWAAENTQLFQRGYGLDVLSFFRDSAFCVGDDSNTKTKDSLPSSESVASTPSPPAFTKTSEKNKTLRFIEKSKYAFLPFLTLISMYHFLAEGGMKSNCDLAQELFCSITARHPNHFFRSPGNKLPKVSVEKDPSGVLVNALLRHAYKDDRGHELLTGFENSRTTSRTIIDNRYGDSDMNDVPDLTVGNGKFAIFVEYLEQRARAMMTGATLNVGGFDPQENSQVFNPLARSFNRWVPVPDTLLSVQGRIPTGFDHDFRPLFTHQVLPLWPLRMISRSPRSARQLNELYYQEEIWAVGNTTFAPSAHFAAVAAQDVHDFNHHLENKKDSATKITTATTTTTSTTTADDDAQTKTKVSKKSKRTLLTEQQFLRKSPKKLEKLEAERQQLLDQLVFSEEKYESLIAKHSRFIGNNSRNPLKNGRSGLNLTIQTKVVKRLRPLVNSMPGFVEVLQTYGKQNFEPNSSVVEKSEFNPFANSVDDDKDMTDA